MPLNNGCEDDLLVSPLIIGEGSVLAVGLVLCNLLPILGSLTLPKYRGSIGLIIGDMSCGSGIHERPAPFHVNTVEELIKGAKGGSWQGDRGGICGQV